MIQDHRAGALAHALFHAVQDGRLPIDFDIDGTMEQLERARVVAVLDGWADRNRTCPAPCANRVDEFTDGGAWRVIVTGYPWFFGATPDAARAAAAKAIESGEA